MGKTRNSDSVDFFGPVYTEFQGKGNEAEAYLREVCEGVAKGALVYPGIGPIDLAWGDKKAGYMKILIKHPEVVGRLQEILSQCQITKQTGNRIVLENDTHKVIVSKMKGTTPTDNWLLSAYEKKEKPVSASSSDIETEPEGKRNGTATPQNGLSSADKGTTLHPENQASRTENRSETEESRTETEESRTDTPPSNPLDRAASMETERKAKGKRDDLRRRSLREAPASVLPKAMQSILSKIAKSFGAEVRYLPTDAESNGIYDPETNTIYLVQDASEALSFVFGHELTHMVKSFSQESYDRLLSAAKQALGSRFSAFASEKETLYRSHGYNHGRAYYEEEAAADAIGSMIDNEDMAKAILRRLTHPVLTRVLDALDHVISHFRGEKAKRAARLRKEIEQAIAAAATSSQRQSDGQTRHAFSGEKGAEAADRADSSAIRRESLGIAKTMLSEGKDAKAIKLATGWDTGKDGKWRREVPDAAFNAPLKDLLRIINTTSGDERQQALKMANNDYATLGSSVKADEIFKAYPQLKSVRLIFDDTLPKESAGYYSEKHNAIVINANDFHPEMQSTLIHELQHAIQRIEGFSTGGSVRSAMEYLSSGTSDAKFDDISIKKQVAYELSQKNNLGLAKEEVSSLIDRLEDDSYPEDKLQQQIDDLCDKHGITEDQLEDIYDMDKVWHEAYRRIAGEVEARNVQTHRRMTEDERRSTLASETEDVPRHDQIALRHSLRDESDRALRDALIDHMRSFGMDVITDEKEGQRMLDMANRNGTSARQMMGDSSETFADRQRKAKENHGTVMPHLNSAYVTAVDVPRHPYLGNIVQATSQAVEAAKEKYAPNGVPKPLRYDNHGTSFDYTISGNAIEICLSPKHQGKSTNKGAHLALAEHLDEIIGNSIEVEEHPTM